MSDDNQEVRAYSVSMAEALAKRSKSRTLKGMNKIRSPLYVDRRFDSLLDLLSTMREAFPNSAELDSYNSPCKLKESHVRKIRADYSFPDSVKVRLPGVADRTCNWHPEKLCIHKGALEAGLRIPVHPFIIRFLAELQVHPCQLYPNAWRFIIIFMLRCRDLGIPLSTTMFRSIFMVKNSSKLKKGWISFQHRPSVPNIVNSHSFPDSHHYWEREFFILKWDGGDWGQFFVKRFGEVEDSSHFIADDGRSHFRVFLTERKLVEAELSFLSLEGNYFSFVDYELYLFLFRYFSFMFQLRRNWTGGRTWLRTLLRG